MLPWLKDGFANPHSAHAAGRKARAAVEVARAAITSLMPSGGSLAFTSGATEALNTEQPESQLVGLLEVVRRRDESFIAMLDELESDDRAAVIAARAAPCDDGPGRELGHGFSLMMRNCTIAMIAVRTTSIQAIALA